MGERTLPPESTIFARVFVSMEASVYGGDISSYSLADRGMVRRRLLRRGTAVPSASLSGMP